MNRRPRTQASPVGPAVGVGAASLRLPADRHGYEIPGEATFPEGIAVDEAYGTFYVSGAGSGAIYRIGLASGAATALLEPGSRARFATVGLTIDEERRLWAAGGTSGEILRFDDLDASPAAGPSVVIGTPPAAETFLNDLLVAPNGDVYVTDSVRPTLFRVRAGSEEAEPFIEFQDPAFEDANGIAITEDGRYLIVVTTGPGRLYRIDVETRDVLEVEIAGGRPIGGDGLVLDGRTLYVVQNGPDQVAVVMLSEDLSRGTLERTLGSGRLSSAATAALVDGRLLVVNAQFAAMETGPELPFTVSVLPTV